MQNRICLLFGIKYPIIQAGMVWCSGWELAAAVSNAGGLGIIGAGSMYPDVLKEHILKCKRATKNPFAVNLPLLYPQIAEHIQVIIDTGVPIVFTSAGNPMLYTERFKEKGIKVVHVVSSAKFALKAQQAGVDAVVAEGFEAGGHNGREETTSICLWPLVKKSIHIPMIAAGGIVDGKSMLAAFVLGAEAVQLGTRFVASTESSAHMAFKNRIVGLPEGDTLLTLKQLQPVRLVKNAFFRQVQALEMRGASEEEMRHALGKGRAKKGMFEGDLLEGELEIGQAASRVSNILPAAQIVQEIWTEFLDAKEKIHTL
jgi:enoyl-[acyl-carrier protein] reductase II